MAQVEYFSKEKHENHNEDLFGYNEKCFVLVDGATDKSGRKYDGRTGGEIISKTMVKESLSSSLTGVKLVRLLNKKISDVYSVLNINKDIVDPRFRFSCSLVVVRVGKKKVHITYLGDAGFRINGKEVVREETQIDIDNAIERAEYIERTGDVAGSRESIMPLLLKQFEYQNNSKHSLGYGVIDGTRTPRKFVKSFTYPRNKIDTIELFSDGYPSIPKEVGIDSWEEAFRMVEREDPDRCKKYKSTKSRDDRTIAIITF